MSDSTSILDTISVSQASKEVTANALSEAAAPAFLFAKRDATTAALTWGFYGGRIDGTAVANGTVALTASNTNYVVAHRTTFAVTAATTTTNWNNTATYGRMYQIVVGTSAPTSWQDHRFGTGGILAPNVTNIKPTESLIIACSDETTALTTGTAKVTFRMPYAFTVTGIRASLSTAQTSGSIFTVDVNESGTTIISTKLTIDNTEKTTTTAATPAVISDASVADDAEMTVDIDQIGDGTAKGLKVYVIGNRT